MKYRILYLILLCVVSLTSWGQTVPSVDPQGSYTTTEGEDIDDASQGQSAPLVARFTANPSNLGDFTARYEWKIFRPGEEDNPRVHRSEEDIEYTFTESGTFHVQLYATFVHYDAVLGNDTLEYPKDFPEATPIVVSISESKLEFPNAFSPNEVPDGFNDVFKAKEGYQSIVSFQAAIFTRWGQKIYSWTDLDGGWDGKWHGRLVKDGVYFLVVNASGADGKKYNIRKAVNVLTGYNNDSTGSSDE